MKLSRWTISGIFRLLGPFYLVGLVALMLALSPRGATAQEDPVLRGVYARARVMGLPTPPIMGGVTTPSFDCRRAATPSERAICSTPELAQLDRDLSAAYAALRGRGDRLLIASQRAWWQQREACGNRVPCLLQKMTERLAELRQWPESTHAGPEPGLAAIAATAAGRPPGTSDQAVVNGAAAAAQWKLPTRLGLPLADASNCNGHDVGLEGLFDYVSCLKPGQIEWTKAIVALSLSLAPDAAAQMSPAAVLSLACLYLPPSQIRRACNRRSTTLRTNQPADAWGRVRAAG